MRRIVQRGGKGRKQDNVPKEVGCGTFTLLRAWLCGGLAVLVHIFVLQKMVKHGCAEH